MTFLTDGCGKLLLSCFLVASAGCMSELVPVESHLLTAISNGAPIPQSSRSMLEGVYSVSDGSELFGDSVVVRWIHDRWYFYAGQSVAFAECSGSLARDTASFNGFYRLVRAASTGEIRLSILPDEGGSAIAKSVPAAGIVLSGEYLLDGSDHSSSLRFEWARPILKRERPFHIIGHRAGGRNSDRLGRSENSVEMAIFSEGLGCTGIEIDIRVTADGQLIVFHDDSFSPRTVRSTYILGDVRNFTLAQIRRHATLIYGEKVPTLEEFLDAVVDSTHLSLVWLDVKTPEVSEQIIAAQLRALERAREHNRPELKIYFGIASEEGRSALLAAPSHGQAEALCELAADVARSIPTGKVWAPRWTNGMQQSETESMQKAGYEVLTWTLDSPDYITKYLNEGRFDGILTNYPTMLAGLSY